MVAPLTNPLHLYRRLLREANYLFDPNARLYFYRHVARAFRKKATKDESKPWKRVVFDPVRPPKPGEIYYMKCGRKLLSTLQRANQGYLIPFENVLKHTYARVGRRRRKMMSEIMIPEPNAPSTQTQNPVDWRKWKPPTKFRALLLDQEKMQSFLGFSMKLRSKAEIAAKNAWGRPMPRNRVKNQVKEWYSRTAKVLLPCLGEEEWLTIRDVALTGSLDVKRRRNIATVPVFTKDQLADLDQATLVEQLAGGPARHVTRSVATLLKRPHHLTPRFLRRRYASTVLRRTPLLAAPHGEHIVFKWDNGNRRIMKTVLPPQHQADTLFG